MFLFEIHTLNYFLAQTRNSTNGLQLKHETNLIIACCVFTVKSYPDVVCLFTCM